MSNTQAVIKVADQLISRLFDHRHFTSGEINYINKELGERANLEGNFERILKIDQNICMISDRNTTESQGEGIIKKLSDQVSSLHLSAERILNIELEERNKEKVLLKDYREERDKVKQECIKKINAKLESLNESLVHEELELERKYLKFEENLRIR